MVLRAPKLGHCVVIVACLLALLILGTRIAYRTSYTSAHLTTTHAHSGILSSGQSLSSPNGAYRLGLERTGDLVLRHNGLPVWWTSTGANRTADGHSVNMVEQGDGFHRLQVEALLPDQTPAPTTVWHSDLLPACRDRELRNGPPRKHGRLELANSGRLRMAGTCDLYVPPGERTRTAAGRSLAVVVAGLYRTNDRTCASHVQALVNNSAFTRVDVFAYMLYEDEGASVTGIETAVRACYGASLRAVRVARAAEVEEDFPGGEAAMLEPCGHRLRRLNNQLKTVDSAASMWREWATSEGYLHDTVLRIRPDTGFADGAQPAFWGVEDLGTGTVVLPHPQGEHFFYCARMTGSVGVGPTDQVAYGSPAAMGHWFSMYRHFPKMVDQASNPMRLAHRCFSGCEVLPSGPSPADCPVPAPCSIECLVAWYLDSQGISFSVEWNWNQGLVRG